MGILRFTVLALIVLSMASPEALAMHYYFEGGGGYTLVSGTQDFFKSEHFKPVTSDTGVTFSINGLVGLTQPMRTFQVYSGLEHRMLLVNNGSAGYGMQATYALLRFEWWRFYLTTGFSPLIMRQVPNKSLFDTMGRDSATGILGQAGFILPITPQVTFNLTSSYQRINATGGGTPTFIEVAGGFRFYYGDYDKVVEHKGFDGYRYPKGWQRSSD